MELERKTVKINGRFYIKHNDIYYPRGYKYDANKKSEDFKICPSITNYFPINGVNYYENNKFILVPLKEKDKIRIDKINRIKETIYPLTQSNGTIRNYYLINGIFVPQNEKIDLTLNPDNFKLPDHVRKAINLKFNGGSGKYY